MTNLIQSLGYANQLGDFIFYANGVELVRLTPTGEIFFRGEGVPSPGLPALETLYAWLTEVIGVLRSKAMELAEVLRKKLRQDLVILEIQRRGVVTDVFSAVP
jgi:hypothetical protein